MGKKLSKAERQRKVAQQCVWAVVNAETGKVVYAHPVRIAAREYKRLRGDDDCVLERVDLRIKGVRA